MSDSSADGETDRTESASATLRRLQGGDAPGEGAFPANRRTDAAALADELSVFKALANGKRLRIIEALRDGELCACELQVVLEAPQSTAASHLRELKDAGLVKTRRQGKWTYYRIGDTAVLQLLDVADALVGEPE